jgi:hypothetical protein
MRMGMAPVNSRPWRERDRSSALVAGLAATIAVWTFAAGFAPDQLDSLSRYSPWLYGPAATGAWALFSAIAYVLISREREPKASLDAKEGYQCRKQVMASKPNGCSVCATQEEKTRLAAVTAGFAVTITAWVAALSFMPYAWMDWLGQAPAWAYCIVSVALWWTLSATMYPLFRASREESA